MNIIAATDDIVLFGTLTDPELLEIVLGAVADAQPVALADHRVFTAAGETFPLLLPCEGAQAEGLLLKNLTDEQVARLDYYEAPYGYELVPVVLADGQRARLYTPTDNQYGKGAPWSLAYWQQTMGAVTREAAHEIMDLFGKIAIADLVRKLGPIRARAQARVNARNDAPPVTLRKGPSRDAVEVVAQNRPYSRFFALDELTLRHTRFDGGTNLVEREVFVAVDAVVVLPYDPVRDTVLLIEQFRPAPFARGDLNPWCLEAVAGRIDGGESPEIAAHREAEEETGLHLSDLVPAANYYPSPGALSEYLYCFIGLADLPDDAAGLGGLDAEDEDIRSMVIPFATLMDAVRSGEVQNGPLLICAFCLDRERTRLRADATPA
ncbi:nudix-type nucleoside diphosphatase (YffH/AdpP family) [Litoreibacter halocynthiae]|uniref:ADP-ribose pyrophosphatase n=1 Tax=Litoreibacter halocynthiae TaxID=1242689 RepID=A0A4R7LPF1_9RHOB|nr:NUDIX domain-containing protein [Litoreibacter halocynthiae]TDT77988.1 nudix-type nucleoside diphosphatase (YffH/AdpP family) [Litoreibacter halocynthiae]